MDKDDPYSNTRGQLISPPNSGGSLPSPMNAGFPTGPGSRNGGPSPPPSIGRSSQGTSMYARRDSSRSQRDEATDAILGEHYVALKRFLSQTSRDGKPTPPANKARDKLQRLTSVQFLELSTDVYDELMRRQAFSRRAAQGGSPNGGPPSYLLPEDSFHPKRNQARQKLASLGPPRFRDLATDVFCELERRIPRFVGGEIPRMGSPAGSMRPSSRAQTPVNGGMNGFPPRAQSRRRPSEAGSIRSMRSGLGPPSGLSPGSVPPSPGLPPNNYDRPMQKQAQSNTIVPNKSTMVEEDDEPMISPTSDGMNSNMNGGINGSVNGNINGNGSMNGDDYGVQRQMSRRENQVDNSELIALQEKNKQLTDDYEAQIKDLRDQIESMDRDMKQKKEDMDAMLDEERSRASANNVEKQGWNDARRDLENQLADSASLAESLQQDMDRMRNDHAAEERQLRNQIDDLRQSLAESARNNNASRNGGGSNADLLRENEDLRQQLREQQEVTMEVRGEAERFLNEMRMLSQQSGSTWEKHAELEKTIETLEAEVRDWRNRYARTKTQLRNMRGSSMGVPIEEDAGRYVREKGFTTDNGLVKDVHVTKFQIAVDELLRRARIEEPERAVDSMKAVVVSVRRITKDIDDATPQDDEMAQTLAKLKARVSGTANNLITAAKNYAMAAGLSPVSLLDAAASHLVAAVVELLRTVKIRTTPAGELEEEDDDGTLTPVESNASYFSPRSNGGQTTATTVSSATTQNSLPPPPPFQGLGGVRDSADSSAYSPINSPRESVDRYGGGFANGRRPMSRGGPNGMNGMSNLSNMNGMNGMNGNYLGINKSLPTAPNGMSNGNDNGGNGYDDGPGAPGRVDQRTEDLKALLDDQTAVMVQIIQDMVGSIRSEAGVEQITSQINEIADIVGKVIAETEASGNGGPSLDKLVSCRQRLVDAGDRGEAMSQTEANGGRKMDMRSWTTSLPPVAFEIARETKELVKRIDRLVLGDTDDFS
ncbi:component of the polarisome [Sporothrix bragantina]|uniref:Component of the polarisome n=1 Tax=Sporothrix bragantina TaxID=671064 RepID=A0ABP0CEU5_9PEZI